MGGEWAQRVETEEEAREVRREVRGLRDGAVYEFWVRASTSAGPGAPSRAVTASPAHTGTKTIRFYHIHIHSNSFIIIFHQSHAKA